MHIKNKSIIIAILIIISSITPSYIFATGNSDAINEVNNAYVEGNNNSQEEVYTEDEEEIDNEEEIEPEEEEVEPEVSPDLTQSTVDLDDFRFDDGLLDAMTDIFFSDEEKYFPEYRAEPDIRDYVPHASVFSGKAVATKTTPDDFKYSLFTDRVDVDEEFLGLKHKFISIQEPWRVPALLSIYISGDSNDHSGLQSMVWQGGSKDRLFYKNYFVAAMVGETSSSVGVQIDSYGNLITNNREVLVPYFMQDSFTREVLRNYSGEVPENLMDSQSVATFIPFKPSDEMIKEMGNLAAKDDKLLVPFYIDSSGNIVDIAGELGGTSIRASELMGFLMNSGSVISERETKRFIEENYYPIVEDFNERFIDTVEQMRTVPFEERDNTTSAFLGETNYGLTTYSGDLGDADMTLENLLLALLQGGAGRFLQLTIAYSVSEIYQELFIDFSSKYIFHTDNFTESNIFNNLFGAYIVIVVFIIIFNIIVFAFNMLRGNRTLVDVIKRVFIIIAATTIPVFVYSSIIDNAFNIIPSRMTETEMRQMMILDRWAILSEQEVEEIDLKQIPFIIDTDFRGTNYNYLIDFKTNQFASEAGREMEQRYLESRSEDNLERHVAEELSESDSRRVSLYVDANHLINYFKEGNDDTGLFTYLIRNEYNGYSSLQNSSREYTEYVKYMREGDEDEVLDPSVFEDGIVRSSEVGRMLYSYYENSDINLAERLNMVSEYIVNNNVSNENRDRLVSRVSDIPVMENKEFYEAVTQDDFNSESEYEAFLMEKSIMESIGYGDITGIYGFLKEITVVDDSNIIVENVDDAIEAHRADIVRQMVKDINRSVIEEHISTIDNLKASMGSHIGDSLLIESMNDVMKLGIYFNISDQISNRFPSGIMESRVESDVYVRNLVIPMIDMVPTNISIENAALYVGANKSLFTLGFFISMVILITIYGLLKLIIIGKILLPVLLLLLLWNYAVKEEYTNKVWFGALFLIGSFAAVHLGFILLWKYLTVSMNTGIAGVIGGRTSFFNTFTNSLVVCMYFALTMKYMLYPTVKTAVQNPGDLGGSVQFERAKDIGGRILKGFNSGISIIAGDSAPKSTESGTRKKSKKGSTDGKREKNMKQDKASADKDRKDTEQDINSKSEEIKNELRTKYVSTEEMSDSREEKKQTNIKKGFSLIKSKMRGSGSSTESEATDGVKEDKTSDKLDHKAKKEKLDRLKKYGKFAASAASEKLAGDTSNKIQLGNEMVANSVSKVLSKNKIENTVQGEDVHFNTDEEFISDIEKEIADSLEASAKEIEKVTIDKGETVTGAHVKDLSVSFESNPELTENIPELVSQGIVQSFEEIPRLDESGRTVGMTTVVRVNSGRDATAVQRFVKEYGSEDITESLETKSVIYAKDNEATFEALKTMGIDDFEEVEENGVHYIKLEVAPTKAEALAKEIDVVGNDLADVMEMDVEREKVIKLNAKNEYIQDKVSNSSVIVLDVDYKNVGGEYVSLTTTGYEELERIESDAESSKTELAEAFRNIGEVKIQSSNMYADSEKANGYRHEVLDLSYSSEEVYSSINDIVSYRGKSEKINQIREVITDIEDIRAEDDRLVIYTRDNITSDDITKIINDVQRYRFEKGEELKKKQSDEKKNNVQEEKVKLKEEVTKSVDMLGSQINRKGDK